MIASADIAKARPTARMAVLNRSRGQRTQNRTDIAAPPLLFAWGPFAARTLFNLLRISLR